MWKTAPSKKMSSMGTELPKMRWTKSFCRNVQDQVQELVQGDERDDDQFFLDTLFIG